MSAKDFRGRLLKPVIARPRRPLSSRASTASCSIRVTYDDVRRSQIQQTFQAVVTVNDATIQIVQVRSRETTTIQRNQRTQIGGSTAERSGIHLVCYQTNRQQFDTVVSFYAWFRVGRSASRLFAFAQIHALQQSTDCASPSSRNSSPNSSSASRYCSSVRIADVPVGHTAFDNHRFKVQYAFDTPRA